MWDSTPDNFPILSPKWARNKEWSPYCLEADKGVERSRVSQAGNKVKEMQGKWEKEEPARVPSLGLSWDRMPCRCHRFCLRRGLLLLGVIVSFSPHYFLCYFFSLSSSFPSFHFFGLLMTLGDPHRHCLSPLGALWTWKVAYVENDPARGFYKEESKDENKWSACSQLYSFHPRMTIHYWLIFCFHLHSCIEYSFTPPHLTYHITLFSKSNLVWLQTASCQGLRKSNSTITGTSFFPGCFVQSRAFREVPCTAQCLSLCYLWMLGKSIVS